MREKGQTEVAKTLETPVFSRGIEILTEKIKFAKAIGKPVVAVQLTYNTSYQISNLGIEVIPNRRDSLENWINRNI